MAGRRLKQEDNLERKHLTFQVYTSVKGMGNQIYQKFEKYGRLHLLKLNFWFMPWESELQNNKEKVLIFQFSIDIRIKFKNLARAQHDLAPGSSLTSSLPMLLFNLWAPAARLSLTYHKHVKYTPASGPLHLLFLWKRYVHIWLSTSLHLGLSSNTDSSKGPSSIQAGLSTPELSTYPIPCFICFYNSFHYLT